MWGSIRKTVAAFTAGDDDAIRHFELAAAHIQRALLDVVIPTYDLYELGVCAEPARLVGGDYIDLYRCDDGDAVLLFGMGDASGKSLAAALNSLMLRYLIRGLFKSLGSTDLAQIVTLANEVLVEDMEPGTFITFLLGTLNIETGLLRVVNAGHEPPLILRANADMAMTLDVHDVVLGVTNVTHYSVEECLLAPGDIAVFYTDGLTEATNTHGEMYTIEGLKRELVRSRELGAQELARAMFDGVKEYTVGPLRDDSTIFVARRTP